ncbi:alpha/beta hydrolase [Bacteroidia bacterium]|nr:alpha/beta hydrolase [Bacteroidia bacterium]
MVMIEHKQIVIDGLLSSYTEAGYGDVVLLLHGWGCNANTFKELQMELSKKFRVFAVDFPGFGRSDEPKEVWGCLEYANWVEQFMKKTRIESPIILAHSFGGRIALVLNSKINLSKLVLTGGAGLIMQKHSSTLSKYMPAFLKKGMFKEFIIKTIGSYDYKNSNPHLREILKKVISEDLRMYAKQISIPTLLIWGENDTTTPLEMGKEFNSIIPNSKLAVMPNCGHYTFIEKKDEFLNLTNEFFER